MLGLPVIKGLFLEIMGFLRKRYVRLKKPISNNKPHGIFTPAWQKD